MLRTGSAVICLLIAASGVALLVQSDMRGPEPQDAGWTARFKGNPATAYQEFLSEYAGKTFAAQHIMAHRVGANLYDALGLDGVGICDASFAFGCYHGFFGRAIADHGTDIVSSLAADCRAQYGASSTGCEHGIGHGIMEYVGPQRLLDGLALCKETEQKDPLFGCTSGLFMEYNAPIEISAHDARTALRPFDPDNPLAPCNTIVPLENRTSCYFEISLWWKDVLGNEPGRIAQMCELADTQAQRDACERGWGTVVAENVEYSPARAASMCAQATAERGRELCMIGVASRFEPAGYPDEARKICGMLDTMQGECLSLLPQ